MVGDKARANHLSDLAARIYASFNEKFWSADLGYCYDVVEKSDGGNDPSLRPNQILSISLPHPVLAEDKWLPVLTIVRDQLLTPMGLRSLAPNDPNYKERYDGDLPGPGMQLIIREPSGLGSLALLLMHGCVRILATWQRLGACLLRSTAR